MAEVVSQVGRLPEAQRPLFHVAAALLGIVFLVKAAVWPLCFWLPGAYGAGAAPVVAMFAIATKVGVYAILRLSMLLSWDAGSAGFGAAVLIFGGIATVVFCTLRALAAPSPARTRAHPLLSPGIGSTACRA